MLQPAPTGEGGLQEQQKLVKPLLEVVSFFLETGSSSQLQQIYGPEQDGFGVIVWPSVASFRAAHRAQKKTGPTSYPFTNVSWAKDRQLFDSPLHNISLPARTSDQHLFVFQVRFEHPTSLRFLLLVPVPQGPAPALRSMKLDQLASQVAGDVSVTSMRETGQMVHGKCGQCGLAKSKLLTCSGCHMAVFCSQVRHCTSSHSSSYLDSVECIVHAAEAGQTAQQFAYCSD